MSDTRNETWRQVEADALAFVRAQLDAPAPLEPGDSVAWATSKFGRTDGLTVAHRVGEPVGDVQTTLCGDLVPEPILRVALSPRLVRVLGSCKYCEAAMALRAFAA